MHRLHLLLLVSLLFITHTAEALTYHRGRSFYVTLLGSNIKFPIFTKEFTEGPNFISVGGIRELWLDDQQKSLGLRMSIENIQPNGAGLGAGLTFWRSEFGDAPFLYDVDGPWQRLARYRNPVHTFLFLDLTPTYFLWESEHHGWSIYSPISLIVDHEQYEIETYSTFELDPTLIDLTTASRSHLNLRFGFGFGTRLHFLSRISLWFEKRWIMGERFNAERLFTEGGFYETGRQKTLYAPINSLGLALSF
ncbi:MAG: hypothetical protein HOC74_27815 [Gemmatimonadetes bacterium]|jgi:hypothetical protein|nr:hypothetical protein [Gemmatimonadota bacterium]